MIYLCFKVELHLSTELVTHYTVTIQYSCADPESFSGGGDRGRGQSKRLKPIYLREIDIPTFNKFLFYWRGGGSGSLDCGSILFSKGIYNIVLSTFRTLIIWMLHIYDGQLSQERIRNP